MIERKPFVPASGKPKNKPGIFLDDRNTIAESPEESPEEHLRHLVPPGTERVTFIIAGRNSNDLDLLDPDKPLSPILT